MTTTTKWIVEAWAEELQTVLQFLTGEDWTLSVSADEPASSPSNCFWWTQRYSAAANASLAIGAPPLAWSELGARVLQAAGVELIEQASARSTYLEAVQQSANALTRALSARLGTTVEATGGTDETPSTIEHTASVIIRSAGFELPPLRIWVSEALSAACNPSPLAAGTALGTAIVRSEPEPLAPTPQSRTMSVLLDVQMPVSISFGRASLPLREVMKLSTGSAVELDRKPDDEVDVIVNNCVIARGEVVVIEGNYGVRITQIISREQRLALRAGGRA